MSEWSILKENLKLGNQIKVAICPFNIILGQFLTSLLKDCLILKENVHVIWFCYSLTYYTLDIMKSEVAQSCPTLCDPMDCSPTDSSIHGIFQARVLERVAISFSRGSSWPRGWTRVSHIAGMCFTIWAIREALDIMKSHVNSHTFVK